MSFLALFPRSFTRSARVYPTSLLSSHPTLNQALPLPLRLAATAPRSYSAASPPPPSRPHSTNEAEIRNKLLDKLEAVECEVEDTSGGCGAFYSIRVSSPAFIGISKIKQHRLVNQVLKEEIKDIHGLTLVTSASDPPTSSN